MNYCNIFARILVIGVLAACSLQAQADEADQVATANGPKSPNEIQARKLLDEAKAKIMGIAALIVDVEEPVLCLTAGDAAKDFEKTGTLTMQRPNKFRIEKVVGGTQRKGQLVAVCDGQKVTRMDDAWFVAYEKPVRAGAFFLGQNFMVQFFLDPKPIQFDPTDPAWRQSVSLFDKNYSAYDRDTKLTYLGKRILEEIEYDVVEIKYATPDVDIRQQVYLDAERMVCEVDTYYCGSIHYIKYRNFQTELPTIDPGAFKVEKPEKMPLVNSNPVQLGEVAPDFRLPGAKGEAEISLKELVKKNKAVFICALSAYAARASGADTWLEEMKLVQDLKNRFEKQGLQVVVVVGDQSLTPDLKHELLLNWMPDLSRFNYPIAIDIDVERGIQGSAYENFQLNGRQNLLLDKDGKVVFASDRLTDSRNGKTYVLALYQALVQIGFSISPADLAGAARR
jgi:peroxiredoxin